MVARERGGDRRDLAREPALDGLAGGLELGHTDHRYMAGLGEIEQAGRRVVGDLAIVEQDFDSAFLERILKSGNVAGAWLGLIHDGELERYVEDPEAHRVGHVAENRLGSGDG